MIRQFIRSRFPRPLDEWYRRKRSTWGRDAKRNASAEEVFTAVYENGEWGSNGDRFYSGSGSHETDVVAPYVATVRDFLEGLPPGERHVVALGCGDFAIGSRITDVCTSYIGVDVVPSLVEHHQEVYGGSVVRTGNRRGSARTYLLT